MKKRTIIITVSAFILLCCLGTIIYQLFFNNKSVNIKNGILNSDQLIKKDFKSKYTSNCKFEDMPVTEVNDITLNVLNEQSSKNIPMLLKAQRYYIPLSYICEKLGYSSKNESDKFLIKNYTNTIHLTDTKYKTNSKKGSLRGNLLHLNGDTYISVSDIEQLFDLTAVFNFEDKNISFFTSNLDVQEPLDISQYSNVAFLRFEDVSTGASYVTDKNQVKMKFIANYLYTKGMKYHIAWIPRFINPPDGIDDNLLETSSIETIGFVNLLDYLINHNAEIGLHGYTHQNGDTESGIGAELSNTINSKPAETRKVIENALDVASALNIPCTFFESPHYMETAAQKSIVEEYFQYIYEPYNTSNVNNIYNHNNHLFLPTPLSYIRDDDASTITDKLSDNDPKTVNSFFYHLYLELKFIDYNTDNNSLNVQYDEKSPLHQVVDSLDGNNIITLHINDLKK